MSSVRLLRRQLVEAAGFTSGTDLENLFAWRLYRAGHEFRQQYPVPGSRYRLDFAWPELGIAVEADGWHHRSPEGAARDVERDSWLRSRGWLIFRIDDRHGEDSTVNQLAKVSAVIHSLKREAIEWH